tara:strand:+ start:1645 stop:4167 length:2523 start_codon:yes stop_codon:yes gene_type:complete
MPKKACCCGVTGGSYIAIPCRYISAAQFDAGIPLWAHYRSGSPQSSGGFGNGAQYDLVGPFRYVGGQKVFDTTRQIRYLLRGAGGGASGVTFTFAYGFGAGGNGSYIEYQKTADLNDVVKSGAGGCGAWGNILWDSIPENYQNGGEAYAINGDGGGASVIGNGMNWYESPAAVAGGGGGAGFVLSNLEPVIPFNGGKQGGNGGIVSGYPGQPGVNYESFNPSPPPPGLCGSGGGGTQTRGGTGGGGGVNNRAKDGTRLSGGKGSIRVGTPVVGSGGGGGGGLYGGGGGAFNAGGGGGSSTISAGLSAYAFESKNNLSANYCNPYMIQSSGVGGRALPLNTNIDGYNGVIVQYYILGECKCDERKNDLPEQLFICLNEIQYSKLIEDLGDPPGPGGFGAAYDPLFTIGNEDYILLGACDQNCENIYKVSPTTDIVDARWSKSSPIPNGELGTINTPACCSQIVCSPICPLTGVNCANCGCDPFNEIFVCCNTKGKPDQYLSVYNGWIYSCSKSNNNWIIPGQLTETVTNQCLDPVNGPQPICNQPSQETCTKTVDIPYTDCHVYYPENCQLSINVQGPTVYYQYFGSPPCSGTKSYTIQGVISLIGSFGGSVRIEYPSEDDFCIVPPAPLSYSLITQFEFYGSRTTENELFSITYDCVPSIEPMIPAGGSGIWKICDAEVNVIKGPLSNIITELNSLLGGRVSLTNLSGGNFYFGDRFNDGITRIVRTIADGKATYTYFVSHTYVSPCGNVVYSGLGPEGPRPPDYPTRNALRPTISSYTGQEQDTWQPLSGLGLVMCTCEITPNADNPEYGSISISCPSPCTSSISVDEYDPYCGEMSAS